MKIIILLILLSFQCIAQETFTGSSTLRTVEFRNGPPSHIVLLSKSNDPGHRLTIYDQETRKIVAYKDSVWVISDAGKALDVMWKIFEQKDSTYQAERDYYNARYNKIYRSYMADLKRAAKREKDFQNLLTELKSIIKGPAKKPVK